VVRNREVACASCPRGAPAPSKDIAARHEAYAGFAEKPRQTQLHRFNSKRFDAAAGLRASPRVGNASMA
jgi:hypothetical protein